MTSDLAVPSALDRVIVDALGPDGERRTAQAELDGRDDFPLAMRLVLKSAASTPLRVDVRGEREGAEVVRRSAELAFVPRERRVLALALLARCVDVTCEVQESCGESGCSDVAVSADDLPSYDVDTFASLGAAPEPVLVAPAAPPADLDAEPARPDGSDGPSALESGTPAAPRDAAAEPAPDVPDAAPDDAGMPPPATDGGACRMERICRGLCEPLPLPGLCECSVACVPADPRAATAVTPRASSARCDTSLPAYESHDLRG